MENFAKEAQHEISKFFHNLFVNGLNKRIDDTPEKVRAQFEPDLKENVQQTIGALVLSPLDEIKRNVGQISEVVDGLEIRVGEAAKIVNQLDRQCLERHRELLEHHDTLVAQEKAQEEAIRACLLDGFASAKDEIVSELAPMRADLARVEGGLKAALESVALVSKRLEESHLLMRKRTTSLILLQVLSCALIIGFWVVK